MSEKGKDKGPPAEGVRAEGANGVATGASRECPAPDCEYLEGHQGEHPCGQPLVEGEPCRHCDKPNPCESCWTPITVAASKGLCAEAGQDTKCSRPRGWMEPVDGYGYD